MFGGVEYSKEEAAELESRIKREQELGRRMGHWSRIEVIEAYKAKLISLATAQSALGVF